MLRIDETSKTLVAPQAGGLVTEASPDREELLALVGASWEAFAQELGLPSLKLLATEPLPGVDMLAFDAAGRPRRGRAGHRRHRRVAALPRAAGRGRRRGARRRAARVRARGPRGRRARRLARSSCCRRRLRPQRALDRRLAHPPPRPRHLDLRGVGHALRQRAPAVRAPRAARRPGRPTPPPRSSGCSPAPRPSRPPLRRRPACPPPPAPRLRASRSFSQSSVRQIRSASCAPVSPGAQLFERTRLLPFALPVPRTTTRATCGSWSDAWSANSALTCTESYSGVGVSSSVDDQDLVEHLRVAVEHVRVLLVRRQRLHQVGRAPAPSRISSVSENWKSLMSPEHRDRGAAGRPRGCPRRTRRRTVRLLCGAGPSRSSHRRLEAAEQRVVAALGVEVVRDREHRPALPEELGRQRLAAAVERRRWSGSMRPGLNVSCGALAAWRPRSFGVVDVAARPVDELRARDRCGTGSRRGCCRRARRRRGAVDRVDLAVLVGRAAGGLDGVDERPCTSAVGVRACAGRRRRRCPGSPPRPRCPGCAGCRRRRGQRARTWSCADRVARSRFSTFIEATASSLAPGASVTSRSQAAVGDRRRSQDG